MHFDGLSIRLNSNGLRSPGTAGTGTAEARGDAIRNVAWQRSPQVVVKVIKIRSPDGLRGIECKGLASVD